MGTAGLGFSSWEQVDAQRGFSPSCCSTTHFRKLLLDLHVQLAFVDFALSSIAPFSINDCLSSSEVDLSLGLCVHWGMCQNDLKERNIVHPTLGEILCSFLSLPNRKLKICLKDTCRTKMKIPFLHCYDCLSYFNSIIFFFNSRGQKVTGRHKARYKIICSLGLNGPGSALNQY